jgi:hypothetical protein
MSRWYRLWGNLADTKDPVSIGAALARVEEGEPLWLPVFSTYGLAVGANDMYKLPDSLFKYIKPNEGSAEIIFRFVPRNSAEAEKPLLRAELRGADSEGNESLCTVQLSLTGNTIVLQAALNDEILETRPSLPLDGLDFVSAAIDFQFFENRIVVSVGLENAKTKTVDAWERLAVDFTPNGESGIRFGAAFEPEDPADSLSAVITEIALFYNEISPALEPVEDEEAEKNPTEIDED